MLEKVRATQRVRRVADRGAAAAALVSAPVLFQRAGVATRLWEVLVPAVFGVVLLAVALLWGHDRFAEWVATGAPRARRAMWLVPAGLPAGAALLYVAMSVNAEWLGAVATVLGAAGAIGTHLALKHLVRRAPGDTSAPSWRRVVLPAELVVGGVGLVWALDAFVTFAWAGLLVALVGTLLLKQVMVELVSGRHLPLGVVIHVAVDVSVAGVLLLLGGAGSAAQLAVLLGAAMAFCGLSVLGLSLVFVRMSQLAGLAVALAGAAVIGAGWLVAWRVLGVAGWASVLTVVVLLVSAWFVFRGEGIIAVVFVGFVAVWGMADGYSPLPPDPHPDAAVRVLALGDSFMSGEGADVYLDGTNEVGADRNECRRAPTAYAYRIAERLGYGLDFVACSGATTADLVRCGPMATGDLRCRPPAEWADATRGDVAGALPQLAHLEPERLAEVDVVLLQIGGNDVGFSTIVKACLLPRSCAERAEQWYANVAALETTLVDTYLTVRRAVGAETPVVVVPYPHVVDADDRCAAGLDRSEYEFIESFTAALDDTIARAAATAGVTVWAEGADVFAGHRLCDEDDGARVAVRHLHLDPPNGAPLVRMAPATWVHNSMHPNPFGHGLIADRLAPVVQAAVESDAPPPPLPDDVSPPGAEAADGSAAPPAASTASVAAAVAADEALTDNAWITAELYRTVQALVWPVLLVLLGSVALAVGLSNIEWFELLRPRRGWWKWADDEAAEAFAQARASGDPELVEGR